MVHGGLRVAAVYLSGVLAGSLWTSILKPGVFLSGASGGVYALITGYKIDIYIVIRNSMHCFLRDPV